MDYKFALQLTLNGHSSKARARRLRRLANFARPLTLADSPSGRII